MSTYQNDPEDIDGGASHYSETIQFQGTKYLVQSMYGKEYPEDEETLMIQQPVENLLQSQEEHLQLTEDTLE